MLSYMHDSLRMASGGARMKAIICNRPFSLTISDREKSTARSGEVLLRIRRIGICGTDFHIYAGRQPFFDYPRIIGHELAGEVVQTPAGSRLREGQVVTVNPYLSCDRCVACRRGKPNCCVAINVLGVHVDGGMREYLALPERAVVPVGALSLDQAAMVEFLAVGAHAVRRGAVTASDRVLVVGAGPIGIAVALLVQLAGGRVLLVDTNAARLARARGAVGIGEVALVDAQITKTLAEHSDGDFFDCVFDATGSIAAMNAGLAHVAHGGRYVLVGVAKGDLTLSDPEFHKRETTLVASRNATAQDFENVIARIVDGAIPTVALHTHSFAALDAPTAIPALIADAGSVLKAIATF